LNRKGATVPFSEATPVKQRQKRFHWADGAGEGRKGFYFYRIGTNDSIKKFVL